MNQVFRFGIGIHRTSTGPDLYTHLFEFLQEPTDRVSDRDEVRVGGKKRVQSMVGNLRKGLMGGVRSIDTQTNESNEQ